MSIEAESVQAPRKTLSALAVFLDRRTLVMLALGFSAGLPFFLIFDTLSAWLRIAGLSIEVIGFFSLVTMIYSFKFLWAPLVDRTRVPILTGRLGHRIPGSPLRESGFSVPRRPSRSSRVCGSRRSPPHCRRSIPPWAGSP